MKVESVRPLINVFPNFSIFSTPSFRGRNFLFNLQSGRVRGGVLGGGQK